MAADPATLAGGGTGDAMAADPATSAGGGTDDVVAGDPAALAGGGTDDALAQMRCIASKCVLSTLSSSSLIHDPAIS